MVDGWVCEAAVRAALALGGRSSLRGAVAKLEVDRSPPRTARPKATAANSTSALRASNGSLLPALLGSVEIFTEIFTIFTPAREDLPGG
jgi:hypothetical protein